MKKRIIIIDHNEHGRLANQLWPYISIYAYALEKNYQLINLSFFQYAHFFNIKQNSITAYIINTIYQLLIKYIPGGNKDKKLRRFRKIYNLFIKLFIISDKDKIIEANDLPDISNIVYLPPTLNHDKKFDNFEINKEKNLFLKGWLFRNPEGIKKYHSKIIQYFKPNKQIEKEVNDFIDDLKKEYKNIIGVHMRQGDYKKKFANGKYYFNELEINKILQDYINFFNIDINNTLFLFCSDEKVDLSMFSKIKTIQSPFTNPLSDVFLLSKTDIIIGSDSTFGPFAAYYGDIPIIIFQKEKIDWEYYKNKKNYFENNKCTHLFQLN